MNLKQEKLLDSEVPISSDKARRDLVTLLSDNLEQYTPPDDVNKLVFDGWDKLVHRFAPVFLEKSPHHLYQWSNLELIAEAMNRLTDVQFLIIGLVRNPMDTLYSAWRNWRTFPEKNQYQWQLAYENLLRSKELFGENLVVVRYEDIVQDTKPLKKVFEFVGVPESSIKSHLHSRSVQKWRRDRIYGFQLAQEVQCLGNRFEYNYDEMHNSLNRTKKLVWPPYKYSQRLGHKCLDPIRPWGRKIRKLVSG